MSLEQLDEHHMKAIPRTRIKKLDVQRGAKNRVPVLRAIFLCKIYISDRMSVPTSELSSMASDAFKVQDSTSDKYVRKLCEWCEDINVEKGKIKFTGNSEKITYTQ